MYLYPYLISTYETDLLIGVHWVAHRPTEHKKLMTNWTYLGRIIEPPRTLGML